MCLSPYKTKNYNSTKQRHVAYQNDHIEMLITNLKILLLVRILSHKVPKTADLVKIGYLKIISD